MTALQERGLSIGQLDRFRCTDMISVNAAYRDHKPGREHALCASTSLIFRSNCNSSGLWKTMSTVAELRVRIEGNDLLNIPSRDFDWLLERCSLSWACSG